MAWIWLLLAGCFEIGFTTCLRYADGFRNIPWTLGFLISATLSMVLLETAARTIPMGTAYAVWTGIGAVGAVVVGMSRASGIVSTIGTGWGAEFCAMAGAVVARRRAANGSARCIVGDLIGGDGGT